MIHKWRLAVNKRKPFMVIYCMELKKAKTMRMVPGIWQMHDFLVQDLVKKYVDDFYLAKHSEDTRPEMLVDSHIKYIQKASILCTYEVMV